MNTIRATLILTIIIHCTCLSTHDFQLYNNLPFPIYYSVYAQQSKPVEHRLIELQPNTSVQEQLHTPNDIMLIVVKDIPAAGQEIPLFTITPQNESCCISLKTHQKKDLSIRIIPNRGPTDTQITHSGENIGHHEIWMTKTTYRPALVHEESKSSIASAAPTVQEQTVNITQTIEPVTTANQQELVTSVLDSSLTHTAVADAQTTTNLVQTGTQEVAPQSIQGASDSKQH